MTAYCEINENYEGLDDDTLKDTDSFSSAPWGNFSAWKNENMENLWARVRPLCDSTFKRVMIGESDHIWKAFKSLFGGGKD